MSMADIAVYLDFNALSLLAMTPEEGEGFEDWMALKKLWDYSRDEKIRLVTSGEDIEMDIIFWLNRQGCCVTDTLTPIEAIDEFERWDRSDKHLTGYWRKIFYYYDQIEFLPKLYDDTDNLYKSFLSIFQNSFYPTGTPDIACDSEQEIHKILTECSRVFDRWFPEQKWRDLRHTDYTLNWNVLESVLSNLGIEPVLDGVPGEKNRRLFGLLNRVVGLSKKSSRNLPMQDSHINFVIGMVIKKYHHQSRNNDLRHIFNCLHHKIGFFVTTDHSLIKLFNEKKDILNNYPEFSYNSLEIMRPRELEIKLQ